MGFRYSDEQINNIKFQETSEERKIRLDNEWFDNFPCRECEIENVCRYNDAVKRIDYPSDVFDVSVTCKIKQKYNSTNIKEERL